LLSYFYDESREEFLQSEPGTVTWKLAQVNHYNTRSWEDYVVKHRRGGGLGIAWDREVNWNVFDRNEDEDVTIAAKLPKARAVYDDIMRDEAVRALYRQSCCLYGMHVDALAREHH
jgi:hypothetical protein